VHPDDGGPILANFGRFGPYLKHGDEFRSLESDDQVFAIELDRAVEMLRAPKSARRRQSAQKTVLRELTRDAVTIKLLSGRYGPYVTDGTVNASLPKTTSPDALTFEQAMELLAARRDAPPAPRRGFTRGKAVTVGSTRKRKTA
jgi:DNA topoisomerase-1